MLPDPSFDESWTTAFTREWYASLPAVYRDVDADGQPLLRFLSLLGDQADEVEQIAQQAEAGVLTDPATTPDSLVLWLAQMVGLTTNAPATVAELRARMGSLDVLRYAGNSASIEVVCKPFLTGEQWVSVRPHEGTPGGDPWILGVFVRDSEAPADLTVIADAIVASGIKPAGYGLTVETVTVTWGEIDDLTPDWTGPKADGNSWENLDNAAW